MEVTDLDARLAMSKEQMEKDAEEKRRLRNEKRRAKKKTDVNAMEWKVEGDGIIR